jgi:GTP cyclohydrolase III
MTRPEFLKGFAIFAITTGAALLSMPYVDRYVEGVAPVKAAIPDGQSKTPDTAEVPPATCVQADGSYKNWPWPNVPTLSPPCAPEK